MPFDTATIDRREIAWTAWERAAAARLGAFNLDGPQHILGYSPWHGREAFDAGLTPAQYARCVLGGQV